MDDLQKQILKLHTHVIVFKKDSIEELVAIKAQAGKTTRRIAEETGLTEAQVQYRISKAQNELGISFRKEFRNGGGFSDIAEEAIAQAASQRIQKQIAPKFLPFADSRVNQ